MGYKELQGPTKDYKGLQSVARGFMGQLLSTGSSKGLYEVTSG